MHIPLQYSSCNQFFIAAVWRNHCNLITVVGLQLARWNNNVNIARRGWIFRALRPALRSHLSSHAGPCRSADTADICFCNAFQVYPKCCSNNALDFQDVFILQITGRFSCQFYLGWDHDQQHLATWWDLGATSGETSTSDIQISIVFSGSWMLQFGPCPHGPFHTCEVWVWEKTFHWAESLMWQSSDLKIIVQRWSFLPPISWEDSFEAVAGMYARHRGLLREIVERRKAAPFVFASCSS